MNRLLWILFAVLVWLLRWLIWLPRLTIDLYDRRVVAEGMGSIIACVSIAWLLVGLFPLFKIVSPDVPWNNVIIVDAMFHYLFGLMLLLDTDEKAVLKSVR